MIRLSSKIAECGLVASDFEEPHGLRFGVAMGVRPHQALFIEHHHFRESITLV